MGERLCFVKFYFVFVSVITITRGAQILGIFHVPAYSHFHLGDRIFRELAARGHNVTVITPFELEKPVDNLRYVVTTDIMKNVEAMKTNFFKDTDIGIVTKVVWFDIMGVHFVDQTLNDPNVQKLLKSDEKFDLVIYENFMNEALSGFAHHYKAPHVILSTIGSNRWCNLKMGNPNNPSYIPDHFLSFSSTMNFFERFYNTMVYVGAELFANLYTYRKQNELLQRYFAGAPHLDELMYNASLMLVNSHPSIGGPLPLLPNMIEIGGFHVKAPKALPQDLQEYLDNAKEGAIFFSMGSNMRSTDMQEDKRNAILKSLAKLKQRVLWKWEDDVLPEKPPNVKLGKWLPQQDILAHPNIKLFITHGGMLSTIEAIYHGVPVLGIPVYGDQELNVRQAINAGYGIGVPYLEITEDKLTLALGEILNNKKYAENAKARSKILHDQQTNPLDRAIYWIEYVIRHKGAPHLKSAALNLKWYECLLLDVVAVVIFGTVLIAYVLSKIVKMFCGKRTHKDISKNKKQN